MSFTYSSTVDLAKSVFFLGETIEKRSTEQKIGFSSDHLGNTRIVYEAEWDADLNQLKFNLKGAYDYFPYGKILRSYVPGNGYERYLTTGHERDHETISENNAGTGLDNRGARFYDSDVGRFLSVDPMAHLRSWVSPYNFVQNNPINRIDPDGRLDSPIYDKSGEFLGTDDQGLQGDAIVMDKGHFKQGMSHSEAKAFDLSPNLGFMSDEAKSKMNTHYAGLKDRPDYDGKLTFGEVTKWSNEGSGDPLFVDGSKIDLSPINVSDVKSAAKNNNGYIDFFEDGKMSTGLVYGNLKVTLTNEKTGSVLLGNKGLLDIHDFKNPFFKAVNDGLYPGTPKDFNIYCAPCNNKVPTE
ncbi:RHS repeat-associated core domain-containing protein [bacterium]|nr:RHS repeat-associated core domain-containing protein [bacterium]